MTQLSLVKLNGFIGRAGKETYAGDGVEAEPQRPGFHELEYAEGDWLYRDSYGGHFQSWGQEVVWLNGKLVWTCLYGGGMEPQFQGDDAMADDTFEFLKKALSAGEKLLAFQPRGPRSFSDGDYAYACEINGDIQKFNGHETIHRAGQLVFTHNFIGGVFI